MYPFCYSIYFSLFVITLLSLFNGCSAHGFVHSIVAGGQTYPGWNPFVDPYADTPARVVRKILNDGFVSNTDPDISCNHDGNDGTGAVANAPAGSQVVFQWDYWPGDHQGPVSTYMASCNGECANFEASNAQWFKIDASGYDSTTQTWAAATLIANNYSWTSTVPSDLAPGQYLIRNEIVALHSITPQFYPSCSQLMVTGSGTDTPSGNELVTMQALYNDVQWPDIWQPPFTFTIPGPAAIGSSSSDDTGNGSTSNTNSPASNASPLSSSTAALVQATTATSSSTPIISDTTSTPRPSSQCLVTSKKRMLHRRKFV